MWLIAKGKLNLLFIRVFLKVVVKISRLLGFVGFRLFNNTKCCYMWGYWWGFNVFLSDLYGFLWVKILWFIKYTVSLRGNVR